MHTQPFNSKEILVVEKQNTTELHSVPLQAKLLRHAMVLIEVPRMLCRYYGLTSTLCWTEHMRLGFDDYLARLTENERYHALEQLWLWGSTAAVAGALFIATALWHLVR